MKRALIVLLLLVLLIACGFALYLGTKHPSNDRAWDVPFSKLNTVTFNDDGSLTIHDLRDFTYATGTTKTTQWKDVTVRPEDIESVWFFLDLFAPKTPQVGHTFLSFRMKDGSAIAFSIEARREATESYSFIGGFLRRYELQYLWGTERDLVAQRTVLKNEQLYMFPLVVSSAQREGLLKEFAKETNKLAEKPRWYNTLTANCTNLLAKIINIYQPHMLPYDISWNLTGLADGYLERQGFIATNGRTREQVRTDHDLTIHRSEIAAHAENAPKAFGAFIRSFLKD